MKSPWSLILTFSAVLFLTATVSGEETQRTGRIFSNWYNGLSNILPRCTGCPPRPCVRDSAVIHGYCCGCSRVSDFLPIDCPGIHVHCPADGRRLCRDYDYMLDCCCP